MEPTHDNTGTSATNPNWVEDAARVCESAAKGDLEARLLHIHDDGASGQLMHSINHLLDMTDAFVRESTASLEHASQGKFYRRVVTTGMLGTFRNACESINDATAVMGEEHEKLEAADRARAKLATDFEEAITKVSQLEQNTKQIMQVVKAIHAISVQTNLLALNSAIEAARVGEAGKGFAVVAGEVKQLADRTAKATLDIEKQMEAVRASAHQTASHIKGIWSRVQKTETPEGSKQAA